MIIGHTFAWAHLPKTGGDATAEMLAVFPELIERADARDDNAKHDSFGVRWREVVGKRRLMNFRRLPSWLLSYHQHVSRFGKFPDYNAGPMPPADIIAGSDAADQHLALLTDGGLFEVDTWLRMEHLAADVLGVVGELTHVSEERRAAVRSVQHVNAMEYDHSLDRWFTPTHLARMYVANPQWHAIEVNLYEAPPPVSAATSLAARAALSD